MHNTPSTLFTKLANCFSIHINKWFYTQTLNLFRPLLFFINWYKLLYYCLHSNTINNKIGRNGGNNLLGNVLREKVTDIGGKHRYVTYQTAGRIRFPAIFKSVKIRRSSRIEVVKVEIK